MGAEMGSRGPVTFVFASLPQGAVQGTSLFCRALQGLNALRADALQTGRIFP